MEKKQTIQYLTDLMGVIQNAYYKRGMFMPLEYDSNSRVRGDLRVHEGSEGGISIDLYHFEGDGKPVCDGLKPCTITYDDGSHDIGHLFCIHYDPDDVTPLVFLLSHDEYGDGGDIDVEPESIPAPVLENIVKWIESVFNNNNENKQRTMNKPTFFPGIQATCEDCQYFCCTGYHSYHCEHKERSAGPFDTICECYIDRRTGESINR